MARSPGSVQGDSLVLNDVELEIFGNAYRTMTSPHEVYVNNEGERITFEKFLRMIQEVQSSRA